MEFSPVAAGHERSGGLHCTCARSQHVRYAAGAGVLVRQRAVRWTTLEPLESTMV
jgi:hypothetical protein